MYKFQMTGFVSKDVQLIDRSVAKDYEEDEEFTKDRRLLHRRKRKNKRKDAIKCTKV